ncbi:hypothetical protein ACFQT0_20035 [Hymenobacter humi]|uniref:Endonuclease n=1 Tax=Hymenobacter humi TaxID=1411620 RepID=A0ABW2U925_9BACT
MWLVGGLAIVATLLPILRETAWWIRAFDFPRLQIVAGLVLSFAAALALPEEPGFGRTFFTVSLGVALVYQAYRIWPYTPLHSLQVVASSRPADDNDNHISLMVANVLMYNRDASRLLGHINKLQPDIVLAVETDDWWLSRRAHRKNVYLHLPRPAAQHLRHAGVFAAAAAGAANPVHSGQGDSLVPRVRGAAQQGVG